MFVIAEGSFESQHSFTGIVWAKVKRSLIKRYEYELEFQFISSIYDYWRRESSYRLEGYEVNHILKLSPENSREIALLKNGEVSEEEVEKFITENIAEYFNEIIEEKGKCGNKFFLKANYIYLPEENSTAYYTNNLVKRDMDELAKINEISLEEVARKITPMPAY